MHIYDYFRVGLTQRAINQKEIPSPVRLVVVLTLSIFTSEAIIMTALYYLPPMNYVIEVLLDAATMTVIIFPMLYGLVYRPMVGYLAERIETERRLRLQTTALEAAANGVIITDLEGRVEWANPTFLNMTGHSSEELIGKNPGFLSPSINDEETARQLWETIQSGQAWQGEIVNRRKDGSLYYQDQIVTPVKDDAGSITHFISIVQDISQRKQAEEALQASNELLEEIFSNLHVLIAYLDKDCNFIRVNRAYAQAGGHEEAFFVGRNHFDLYPNEENESIFREVAKKGKTFTVLEKPFVYAEYPERGVTYWDWSLQPVKDAHNQVAGLLLTLVDRTEHVYSEHALRKTQHDYETLVNTIDGIVWVADFPSFQFTFVSQQSERLLGYPPDRWTSQADFWISHVHPEDQAWVGDFCRRATEQRKDHQFEYRMINAWGKVVWMRDIVTVVEDERGAIKLAGVMVDVTDRKRAEQKVEAERRRLFSILDQLPAFVFLVAPDYSIHYANRHFHQTFGSPDDTPCYQLLHHQNEPCADCRVLEALETRRTTEWQFTAFNGRRYQISNYLFTDVNSASLVLMMGIDITDRVNAEELMRRNTARAEALAHISQLFVETPFDQDVLLDEISKQMTSLIGDGVLIRLATADGQALEAITLAHRDPQVKSKLMEIIQKFSHLSSENLAGRVYTSGQPLLIPEVSQDIMEGTTPEYRQLYHLVAPHSVLIVPLRSHARVIGTITLIRDHPGEPYTLEDQAFTQSLADRAALAITNARLYTELDHKLKEEQAMRNQLVQAEKLMIMGRMVASVAHELNNPLQTIKNCLFLTQQELHPDSPTQDYLNMAQAETSRLTELVRQLRDVYRPKSAEEIKPVDINQVLDEVHSLISPHLERHRVSWNITKPDNREFVPGVANQLKQVFLNISLNAIEAMQPQGGRLSVVVEQLASTHELSISFSDDGPGIPPEVLPKMFEPFFSTKEAGTGLGLAITYDIVQRHLGRIVVENNAGGGARFTVTLPAM